MDVLQLGAAQMPDSSQKAVNRDASGYFPPPTFSDCHTVWEVERVGLVTHWVGKDGVPQGEVLQTDACARRLEKAGQSGQPNHRKNAVFDQGRGLTTTQGLSCPIWVPKEEPEH